MQQGQCKFCQKTADLHDSHFMPAAMYKALLDRARKNPHPLVITNTRTERTSKQVTDYVLCTECEQRFSRRESYVMKLIGRGVRFPLLEKMKAVGPLRRYSESDEYVGASLGTDAEKLGYFALSIIWRGRLTNGLTRLAASPNTSILER